jgi:starch-binding outer membrane protein, SusD/RagB family
MKKYILRSSLVAAVSLLSATSCTDLVEKPYSDAQPADFFVNAASFESALIPAYASLRGYIWNYWNLSQHTSDETQAPTRGGDWGDGGQWVRLNQHTFGPNEGLVNDLWNDLFQGVSRANNAIETFSKAPDSVKEKALFVSESRALRAWYYYLLCDTFGNVPLVTVAQSDPANPPKQASRAEVFAFVESELKAVLPNLLDKAPYGRFDKGVANAILAKLYLNAQVWTGTARWADAVTYSDAVINSGKYSLSASYFDNFKTSNEKSAEIVLAAAFSSSKDLGFPNMNFYMRTLHYNQIPASPWNGFCVIAEVYDAFDAKDPRKSVMWEGQQYSDLGWPAKATTGTALKDRTGAPLAFTKGSPMTDANESNGIRVPKYQPDVAAPGGQGENDFIILRLADIILAKAEALVRQGKAADALPLINQIRTRAGVEPLKAVTVEDVFKERSYEMLWEGVRRQDQIRFGKFLDAYTNKTSKSDPKYVLFPIPTNQLASNPNLKQNAGY